MYPRNLSKFKVILLILSLGINHITMAGSNLDLSIPRDILTNENDHLRNQKSLTDVDYQGIIHSPEHDFYVRNANEKILRRLNAVPAQDKFGKQICGKVQYGAKVRPDGTLEVVEVIPVKQTENHESKVEVYANPIPSFQDAKKVSRLDNYTSDDDEINIFVNAMTQAIHAAAPFPPYPKDVRDGPQISDIQKSRIRFTLIHGTFWRACHGWTPPQKTKLR